MGEFALRATERGSRLTLGQLAQFFELSGVELFRLLFDSIVFDSPTLELFSGRKPGDIEGRGLDGFQACEDLYWWKAFQKLCKVDK